MAIRPAALLYTGATFHVAVAAFHAWFFRLFRWDEELARLSSINRAIMRTLNNCLIVLLLGVAWLEFAHAEALLGTPLGRAIVVGIAGFWILR